MQKWKGVDKHTQCAFFFPQRLSFALLSSLGDLDLIHLKHLIFILCLLLLLLRFLLRSFSHPLPTAVIHLRPSEIVVDTATRSSGASWSLDSPCASRDLKAWPFESVSSRNRGTLDPSPPRINRKRRKKQPTNQPTNILPRHDILSPRHTHPLDRDQQLESV